MLIKEVSLEKQAIFAIDTILFISSNIVFTLPKKAIEDNEQLT